MKFLDLQVPDNGRIPGIDFIRGIAALLVTLAHFCIIFQSNSPATKMLAYGQMGVDMFFIVSGYVIVYTLDRNGYRIRNFFTFLLRRSCRIDPPYILSIFLFLLTFKAAAIFGITWPGTEFEIVKFLAHIFYVVPFTSFSFYSHIYWTLCVEFQFYILIGLLYFLKDSDGYRFLFLLIFSIFSLIPLPNQGYVILHYGCIFSLGIALYQYSKDQNLLYLVSIIVAIAITYYVFRLALLFCLFTVISIVVIKTIGKVFRFLGTISYSLYLTHLVLMIPVIQIKSRLPVANKYEGIYFIIATLIAIAFAYLFYIVIERPSIAWSKRITYQKD